MAQMASLHAELTSMRGGAIRPRADLKGEQTPIGTCYATGAAVYLDDQQYWRMYQFDEGDKYNYGLSEGQMIIRHPHHGWVIADTIDFEDVN